MKNLFALFTMIALLMVGCSTNDNPAASSATSIHSTATSFAKPVIGVPVITVTASTDTLYAKNKKLVTVIFNGTVTNYLNASYSLTDEYGKLSYSGTISVSPFSIPLSLEAKRKGNDKDGRLYTFTVTAVGDSTRTATATVVVPHNKKKNGNNGHNGHDGDDDDDDDDDCGNDGHHG